MKRRSVPVILVVAAGLVAGIVSGSAAAPATKVSAQQTIRLLRVGAYTPVDVIDPARVSGFGVPLVSLGLEMLMKLSPDGSIKPNLATSVKNPNPFTFIYTLRRGVKFWDGNELTAVDVANAINYYRYPGFRGSAAFASVRDVKATNRYTVQVTLKRRDADWPANSATSTWIFEKKYQAEHPTTMGRPGVLIMGTGPFKFDSLDPTRGVELSANANWWGGKVHIQHISVKFISDLTAQGLAFRAGDIDVWELINDPKAFESASGSKVISKPGCGFGFFAMNRTNPPWDDVHVRRAVAYAINKNDIVAAAGGPEVGSPSTFTILTPPLLRLLGSKKAVDKLLKSLPQYQFNLTKARQELAKSRYPNGFTTTLPTFSTIANIAQAISGDLSKIGINLQVKLLPPAQFVGLVTGPLENIGAYMLRNGFCSPSFSGVLYGMVHSRSTRRPGPFGVYASPRADALINAGAQTLDPAKRLAIYGKLLKLLGEDVPYIILYSFNFNYAISNKYTWPTYDAFHNYRPWALEIKLK